MNVINSYIERFLKIKKQSNVNVSTIERYDIFVIKKDDKFYIIKDRRTYKYQVENTFHEIYEYLFERRNNSIYILDYDVLTRANKIVFRNYIIRALGGKNFGM